ISKGNPIPRNGRGKSCSISARSAKGSVELAVDDDNEVPRFVVFDREISKKDANILALAEACDEGPSYQTALNC
ncbi:unnamed protein product, partial [Brassica napus]